MRVLLTGGGTAGHVNPLLAIAETVRQNCPGAQIEFAGVRHGKEADLVPREGYRLHFVKSMGIQRSISPETLKAICLTFTSPRAKETQKILDEFDPDIVIGSGGYVSWPIMKAAVMRGIPTAMHESNARPGKVIRKLCNRVDRVWINFAATRDFLRVKNPNRVMQVGNPLRNDFASLSREEARRRLGIDGERRLLLSFGGSMGAEAVNRAVIRMMADYSSQHPEILHIHAAGKRDFEVTAEEFRHRGLHEASNCVLKEYIYDMPLHMAAADVVISRAGAMTISELALMGKAAILIPSPNVAADHQRVNAGELEEIGAAVVVEESELEEDVLTKVARELLSDEMRQRKMEKQIREFANPDANRMIWNDILSLIKK